MRVSARQERTKGWDQERLSHARGLVVGAGGLGGEVGEGLVRKGIGFLDICDFDVVTPSNLNRQKFSKHNLYKNKAIELCRILSRQGFLGGRLRGRPCSFQDLDKELLDVDFVVCGVDNQLPDTRLAVCNWCDERGIPGVFLGVSTDADFGYVLVQVPGEACWGCVFKPEFALPRPSTDVLCPGVPASLDILKTLGGLACYAVDTLVMNRPRDWNYRVVSLGRREYGSSYRGGAFSAWHSEAFETNKLYATGEFRRFVTTDRRNIEFSPRHQHRNPIWSDRTTKNFNSRAASSDNEGCFCLEAAGPSQLADDLSVRFGRREGNDHPNTREDRARSSAMDRAPT